MTKSMKTCVIISSLIFLLFLIGCASDEQSIMLTEKHLDQMNSQDFALAEDKNQLQVSIDNKLYSIKNLVSLDKNQDNTMYFYLSTDDEKKLLLVVLNDELQKVQWGAYYTENSYFDPVELVAIVVEPFPERHQSAVMHIYDFAVDYLFTDETDLSFWPGTSEGDKQAYYQLPVYEKNMSGYYTIFWRQANYSFTDNTYSISEEFRGSFLTSGDESTLDELEPLEYSMERWTYPQEYSPIGRNVNSTYEVVIVSPKNEEANWENYQIFTNDKNTGETAMISFGSIFPYQDDLISISPAKNKDDRIAFIVETKEFSYDFYFDPSGETTDIFLRPSSFVKLYPV